jgi:membrane protease YdiL (CAAX protease family)
LDPVTDTALTGTETARTSWPEPVSRPDRQHWWSIQPPPPGPAISARRAYAEVLGVFAAFFAASIIAGAESLAKRYPTPNGSWAAFVPAAVNQIAIAALAVTVVVLLSGRRGISPRLLGLGLPRRPGGGTAAGHTFRMGVWALAALLAGGTVTLALETGKLNVPVHQNGGFLVYAIAASVAAGIVEETVVLAFLVTTLRQARRPLPEIVLVAVLLRCSYHDYYGPGVLGIAVWAAVFVWLFLRAGSVIPLIVVHFLWDATQFSSMQPHLKQGVAVLALAALVLLPLAAGITWLVEYLSRPPRQPQYPPPQYPPPVYDAWPPPRLPPGGDE